MSDDEYYYDEYDDFHEMLYDADPNPDLADDLAGGAAYSPVWQDNPVEELRDYFSDWEYYSDDYFDDDPNLLNRPKKDETSRKLGVGNKKVLQPAIRGRKRKLSEAREKPEVEQGESDALAACLKGTVWKLRSPEPPTSYIRGIEKPVALRLNTEIMRAAYNNNQGFGRRLRSDESWANDLSLADMGLRPERSMSMHEKPALEEEEEGGDADEDEDEDGVEEAIDDEDVDEEAVVAETMIEEPYRVEIQSEPTPIESKLIQAEIDDGPPSRKRRKLSASRLEDKKSALPTPDASLTSEQSEQAEELGGGSPHGRAKRGRGRPKKAEPASRLEEANKAEFEKTKTTNRAGRKRKLSVSEASATGSTASSRAKRQATSKVLSDATPVIVTAAATRPTRKQQK